MTTTRTTWGMTMHQHLREIVVAGILGSATLGFMPLGCTSRLGPVVATQTEGVGASMLPREEVRSGQHYVKI